MGKKHPLARYVLPGTVNPPDTVCIQVEVPNDRYHIAAFMGQIYALASASQWQNDDAHTAIEVAKVWWGVFNNLRHCNNIQINSGADEGIEQMIRQNPTNPCLLETSINGTDWCVFADLSKCVPAGGQPGSGSPQPNPGGGEQCYNARMQGNGKWLLPTQVNTGDVITISAVSDAATDGSGIWYCPNGQTFFLGGCVGATTTSGSDPAPSVPHMRLIAKIGSNYYDAYNTSITVPSSTSFSNVEFQLNDASLSDNYGEITFKVCVTNNLAATWQHTFDFALADGGWITQSFAVGTPGLYTPGLYWTYGDAQNPSTNYYRCVALQRGLASRTITRVEMIFDISGLNTNQPLSNHAVNIVANSTELTFITWNSLTNANDQHLVWMGSQAGVTTLYVFAASSYFLPTATYQGAAHIKKVIVSGLGTDPF